ncbi:hypothetical protein TELCIR_23476 [Teladorsagia circumcincta]|uniref:Uncharacterized protein n=1 Tax=Teladorsagia circumcincta TaxID=45464 RepID=A0A2G9TAZ7_TELCI|nr:hypothetical protein TELCIR_23476 [Teladorsagia circumcincta]
MDGSFSETVRSSGIGLWSDCEQRCLQHIKYYECYGCCVQVAEVRTNHRRWPGTCKCSGLHWKARNQSMIYLFMI